MKTPRYTAKEAVATACGMDIDEMNDARYQPTMWNMPIWDFGNKPYSARPIGSKKTPKSRDHHLMGDAYEWKPVFTWKTWEVIEGHELEDDE